jgi:hypothetical protein
VSEAVLGEGQEMKTEVEDVASNNINRPKRLIAAGILITVTPVSPFVPIKTLRCSNFFLRTENFAPTV